MDYRMAPLPVTFSDLEGYFCCLKHLSIRHGGSRPLWCAGRVIGSDVNNIGGSRRWLITVLTSPRLFVQKFIDNTHGIACSLCDSCA